jgi:hypothetical protein
MALMGFLSKSPHESKDPEVRLEAVRDTDDQSLLAKLAKYDSSPRVRKAAVAKVTDQELLTSIALDGKEIDSRVAAVERIESQKTLAEIIKVRKNFKLMGACFAGITDKKILNDIANDTEYNMSARRMAIEGFADESYLAEISSHDKTVAGPKSPQEIDTLIKRHGGVRLARALGRFRGSKSSILALAQIMQRGGEPASVALEYVAKALAHANSDISREAEQQLSSLKDGELIAQLISMMDDPNLYHKILAILARIDHPDARQIVENSK